jgi:hypothetical protein
MAQERHEHASTQTDGVICSQVKAVDASGSDVSPSRIFAFVCWEFRRFESVENRQTTYDARPCWIEALGAPSGVKRRRDQLVVLV